MSTRRNLVISLVSALLAGMMVYMIYVVQLRHIRAQETVRVLAPNRFVDAGTVLTSDLLHEQEILAGAMREDMARSAKDVLGLAAAVPLGRDEPILLWKLDALHMMPQKGMSIFQIPKTYIKSIASGVRAGDRVYIYVSGEEHHSGRLFEEPVTVSSVKSASNTEIDNAERSVLLSKARGDAEHLYTARRDANAPIDHINLNLTEEQWMAIDRLCRDGQAKLVIAYAGFVVGKSMDGQMPKGSATGEFTGETAEESMGEPKEESLAASEDVKGGSRK